MKIEKRNILLSSTIESMPYASVTSGGRGSKFPNRDIKSHERALLKKLDECYSHKQVAAIKYKNGTCLEFSSARDYDLKFESLDNKRNGLYLLNVKEENDVTKALVYVSSGKECLLSKKIEDYGTKLTRNGKPKNNDLVSSIEDVKLASLETFWIGPKNHIPKKAPVWCELWLRYNYKLQSKDTWEAVEEELKNICLNFNIELDDSHLLFPERLVKLARVTSEQLELIIGECAYVAEIRRAQEPITFFNEISNKEQKEWSEDLLKRTTYKRDGVAVCLLDTGVNTSHSLIKPAVDDSHVHVLKNDWDKYDNQGHGTEMAGVLLFNYLSEALQTISKVEVPYELESVKILPSNGENKPELYGYVTEQAVSLAEIANPKAKRVLCMAVSSPEYSTYDGSPTSWSAAIDSITSGANEEDEKRLFVISAGNVMPNEFENSSYPEANELHGVESPGQSWNAITVGAYSKDIQIVSSDYKNFKPVASMYELSPYSSTSLTWKKNWPVKPEVLFDGGNIVTNGKDFLECPDLELLTTYYQPYVKQFSTINATSSATAQAGWFCGQLISAYPEFWPETIRALIIHSAEWTDEMKRQFCQEDTKKKGRYILLRTCGYGIPNLEKAIKCVNNSVNMIIQGEIQPFFSKDLLNEMHLHTLPWPKEVLKNLGEENVTLKVTLSYFIEPGPGEIGWKNRYRYPSCGLRFDIINSNESTDDFKKRVNRKMRGDDPKDSGDGTSGSERWYLGSSNRDVGSIHSDFCQLSAIDLSECNRIAVYPVTGWWKGRDYLGKVKKRVRYSLVVSLSTAKTDIDLYTPIVTQIANVTMV